MVLIPKIINVEDKDWNALPNGERSDIIRKFIKDYVSAQKENLNDINLELLKIEIIRLENQKVRIDTELQSKRAILDNSIKAQEDDRVKRLELEKQHIEDSKKCAICKLPKADSMKMHNFPIGQICNACFMEKREFTRWFREAV